jgi:hypothetical protein
MGSPVTLMSLISLMVLACGAQSSELLQGQSANSNDQAASSCRCNSTGQWGIPDEHSLQVRLI